MRGNRSTADKWITPDSGKESGVFSWSLRWVLSMLYPSLHLGFLFPLRHLPIHPHKLRHALALGVQLAPEAVGFHDGTVVELVLLMMRREHQLHSKSGSSLSGLQQMIGGTYLLLIYLQSCKLISSVIIFAKYSTKIYKADNA